MSFLTYNSILNAEFDCFISTTKASYKFSMADGEGCVYYDSSDWLDEPHNNSNKSEIIISGWFVNDKYERNNLKWLQKCLDEGEEFTTISKKIISGMFICLYYDKDVGNVKVFTDPFSLSPHYYNISDGSLHISPCAAIFSQPKNKSIEEILLAQGHLFGNYTIYENVYRFIPGDIIEIVNSDIKVSNYGYEINAVDNIDVIQEARALLSATPSELQSIALSAGFDSRFILTISDPKFAYTWGPENSADVQNGKKLAAFRNIIFESFRFKSNSVTETDKSICNQLFSGSVRAYNPQFFSNYRHAASLSVKNTIALDGYLGDVLQRGVYMSFGGKLGEFYKLFPFLTPLLLKPEYLLRKRYRKLSDEQFNYVLEDFHNKTSKINGIDPLQKVTYYEFIYGRGLRFITSGALVMNLCFKTTIPLFASRNIFNYFINKKAADILTYKTFHEVWKNQDAFYRNMKSEGAYSPSTNPKLVPFLNLFGRVITNFHPKFKNYTKE